MIANALTALADPTRRRLFELVADQPRSVGELAGHVTVSRPAVSQHLKVLRQACLVREHRVGTRHVYCLDPAGLDAVHTYFDSFWQRSLAALKAAVEQSATSEQTAAKEAR